MAIKRRFNPYSGIRVDIPHLRSLESAVSNDFDDALRGLVTGLNRPFLLRGFDVQIPSASINASSLKITVADSAVLHSTATESGTILTVPPGTADEVLDPSNARVIGAFQNGVPNYVALDYRRTTDLSTVDNSAGWSAAQKLEFQRTAPLGRILDYRFVISSSGFGNGLPLYIVGVSSTGAVQYITKGVTSLFRLGSGGPNPDPTFSFQWGNYVNPQPGAPPRREWINNQTSLTTNPVTVAPGADANAFQFGDFAIKSLKDWMDAVMTRFKEITGSTYWYLSSPLTLSPQSIFSVWFDAVGSVLTGAGNLSYNYILEAVNPDYGAFQALSTDRFIGPTDSYVVGVQTGTRATMSSFNAAQLVINSITNPSTTPFLYDEALQGRRISRIDLTKSQLSDRTEGGFRYGEYKRTPLNASTYKDVASWSYDDRIITIVTSTSHLMKVGDQVEVTGLQLSSIDQPPNGVYLIKEVVNSTTFRISNLFRVTGTPSVTLGVSKVRQDRPFDTPLYDSFRHPYSTRFSVSSWLYSGANITAVIPNHNFRDPIVASGSVTSGLFTITGMSSTTGIRLGQEVTGPGLVAGTTYVEEILSSTSVRVNKAASSTTSGAYTFYDVMVVSGLTATTNAPNGRYRVTGLGSGQFEVEYTAGATPTGPAGVALDTSSIGPVGYARYDRTDTLMTVDGATPDQYNVIDAAMEALDDCQFRFVLGPDTIPTLGNASGPIVFDGVVAQSSVQNPIRVQEITNNGTGTLTVTTYTPHGLVTTPGPIAFTIFGDSNQSIYFRTYTGVSIQFVDSVTFQIIGTGIVSGASYTNVDTTTPPTWSSLTTYSPGDVVEYPGASRIFYEALTITLNDQPDVSPSDWQLTFIDGADPVFVKFSNNPYPGPIQWDQDMVVKAVIGDKFFVIPKTATADGTPLANKFNVNGVTGTAYLQDGEVAYIILERDRKVSSDALYTASGGNQIAGAGPPLDEDGNPLKAGDFVKFDDETETFWYRIAGTPGTPIVSNTFFLVSDRGQPTTADQRPSRTGKLRYTKAYYDTVTVQPHWLVEPSTDVYWLAVRRDNGSLASKVYLRSLELEAGEVRQINDNTTTNLLTYTGAGSESAVNPNYTVADQSGQYQYRQTLRVQQLDSEVRQLSFYQGPDLGFQAGDRIVKRVGNVAFTYSVKSVPTSRTIVLNEALTEIGNIDTISRDAAGLITVVTEDPHNLTTGQVVVIDGVEPEIFDGIVTVTVLDALTFTYQEQVTFLGDTNNLSDVITNVLPGDIVRLKTGMSITGTGIPASTTIIAFPSSTSVQISNAATATNAGVTLTATFTGVLAGTGGFVSVNDELAVGVDDEVEYLRQNYVLNDSDNLTLGLRKEDRELARINTALTRPVYDESFLVQRINMTGSGLIESGEYVYAGPKDNPTFLAWVLHGNGVKQDPDTIEGVSVPMPGGHPSVGPNAILVSIVSGTITHGSSLFQKGVDSGRDVDNSGNPPFPSPTIAGGLSNDGVEMALPPNRRTQVVGSSYVQWPAYLTYKASTNPTLAGEELMVIINDSIREAEVDYRESFGGPKGKIRIIRDLPAATRIRCRLMPAYGSALAARAAGVTLQTAYDASFLNNYTVEELSGKPIVLVSGDQPTGGPALRVFGSIELDSVFAGNVVGGIMGTADKRFDVGKELNKPREVWSAYSTVKTHDSHPGSGERHHTAAHTTTTAAATPIPGSEVTIPTQPAGKSVRIRAKATAWRSDGTYGTAAFELHGLFHRTGSNPVQAIGSPTSLIVGCDGDGLTYALAFGISGDDVVVVAYGGVGTVQWSVAIEQQAVSTST